MSIGREVAYGSEVCLWAHKGKLNFTFCVAKHFTHLRKQIYFTSCKARYFTKKHLFWYLSFFILHKTQHIPKKQAQTLLLKGLSFFVCQGHFFSFRTI
jgi:hypothetical protein